MKRFSHKHNSNDSKSDIISITINYMLMSSNNQLLHNWMILLFSYLLSRSFSLNVLLPYHVITISCYYHFMSLPYHVITCVVHVISLQKILQQKIDVYSGLFFGYSVNRVLACQLFTDKIASVFHIKLHPVELQLKTWRYIFLSLK